MKKKKNLNFTEGKFGVQQRYAGLLGNANVVVKTAAICLIDHPCNLVYKNKSDITR